MNTSGTTFWDADLGRPVGPKAQHHQNIEDSVIRKFTNGWAVYNRSGQAQTITLPSSATPVSDSGKSCVHKPPAPRPRRRNLPQSPKTPLMSMVMGGSTS